MESGALLNVLGDSGWFLASFDCPAEFFSLICNFLLVFESPINERHPLALNLPQISLTLEYPDALSHQPPMPKIHEPISHILPDTVSEELLT